MHLRWVDDAAEIAERSGDILALLDSTTRENGILGYSERLTPEQRSRFIKSLCDAIEFSGAQVLVCRDGAAIVGMLIMSPSGIPTTRHVATLSKCVIHPDHRGGTTVMRAVDALIEKAKDLGIELLTLDVRENSSAHRLWQRCGFRTFGILSDYCRFDGVSFNGHYLCQRTDELEKLSEKWKRRSSNALVTS